MFEGPAKLSVAGTWMKSSAGPSIAQGRDENQSWPSNPPTAHSRSAWTLLHSSFLHGRRLQILKPKSHAARTNKLRQNLHSLKEDRFKKGGPFACLAVSLFKLLLCNFGTNLNELAALPRILCLACSAARHTVCELGSH